MPISESVRDAIIAEAAKMTLDRQVIVDYGDLSIRDLFRRLYGDIRAIYSSEPDTDWDPNP